MKRATCILACLAALAAPTAVWAQKGGTITGIVLDSLSQPIPEADIILRPGNNRTRSDSTGRFSLTGLNDGGYVLSARKVGFAPERWDLKLSKNGRLDVKFVLARRVELDTIVVTARRECALYSLDGFMCRQRSGRGLYLDYPDIDERAVQYTADLFRDIPGFRVELRRTRFGLDRVAVPSNGFGCIASLVDGRPAGLANPIPRLPSDLSALEVYTKPDSVPVEYQRYTWPPGDVTRTGRCSVVIYWTTWAAYNP